MIVLLITYEPEKKNIVSKNDTDGAYKIYYEIEGDSTHFDDASKKEDVFRVYSRKKSDTNFTYIGDTVYSMIIRIENRTILSLFLQNDQVKRRTLYAGPEDYVSSVCRECKYHGEVDGSFFFVDTS